MPPTFASPPPATPAKRPGISEFATIAGLEALVRGSTLAVYPLLLYRAWGDAAVVSELYFAIGILSLLTALTVPLLAQRLQRRWVYVLGLSLYVLSAALGMLLVAREHKSASGRDVVLRGARGQVGKLIGLTRFDQMFVIES